MPGYSVSKQAREARLARLRHGRARFDDVFVPDENLLGQENKGFYLIMANFQWERLVMALGAVGAMQAMLRRTPSSTPASATPSAARSESTRRSATSSPRWRSSSRPRASLTYHALRLFVDGQDAIREVTMAKLLSQRAAFEVADDCLQIHGGAGYMREYGIERAVRDARLGPIGGGTDEIMKEILGKQLGL